MLEKLREKVGANSRVLEGNMDAIMSALRPSQQAQFLVWIENNQTCMMMLNSLWGQLEDQQSAARAAAAAARGSTAGGVNGVPVISRSTASSGHRGYGAFVPAKYGLTCGALGVGPLEDVGAPERINGFTGEKLPAAGGGGGGSGSSAGAAVSSAAAVVSAASSGASGGASGGAEASGQRPSKRARR